MSEEQLDVSLQDFTLTMDNSNGDTIQDDTIIESLEIATQDVVTEEVKDLREDVKCDDGKLIDEPNSPSESTNKTSSKSRELKLLLALSKEANLDTNIAYKRKSVEPKIFERGINDSDDTLNKQQKPTNTSKLDDSDSSNIADDDNGKETKEKDIAKLGKRKAVDEPGAGGAVFEDGKKIKVVSNSVTSILNEKKKDPFCWQCHHEEPTIFCETCPRSFHQRCLRQNVAQTTRFLCPECDTIMKAENLKERSPAMKGMSLVHLCGLLKFALKRMMEVAGCEPFIHPVSETEFPEYLMYIVQPMDLTCLEKNIKANVYGSTQAFESDAKWLVHNSIIFNSFQSKLTSVAKSLFKICKQEMSEIENCASCYLNANTKLKTWFIEVCPKPHLLVWAKLKGFPFWPAKAMRTNSSGMVDVRFFGAHDRAWVSYKDCFLYSLKDPNSNKQKRNDINESIKEVKIYIENLEKKYGKFCYAEYRIPFEPDQEIKQLQLMLPNYDPNSKRKTRISRRLSIKNTKNGTYNLAQLDEAETIATDPLAIEEAKVDSIGDNNYQKNEDLNMNNENLSNSSRDSFTSNGNENNPLISDPIAEIQGDSTPDITDKLRIITIVGAENGCKSVTDNIVESNLSSSISSTELAKESDLPCTISTETQPTSPKKALEEKLNSDNISPPQSEMNVSSNKSKISDILIMKLMKKLTEPIDRTTDSNKVEPINTEVTPVVENAIENIPEDPSEVQNNVKDMPDDKDKSENEETASDNSNQSESVGVTETNITTVSITNDDLPHENSSFVIDTNEKMDIDNEAPVISADNRIDDVDNEGVSEKMTVDVREENESVNKIVNNEEIEIEKQTDPVKIGKKRRRSERETSTHFEDNDNSQKKTKTDLSTEILNSSEENSSSSKSILESRLITGNESESCIINETSQDNAILNESSGADSDGNSITIKNEPLSDGDLSGTECNQSLPHTSSTLNSSEKEKSEVTKPGFKIVDNLSKVIDEVASNFSQAHANEEITIIKLPKRKEIFIKPLSKLQHPKQRARKTFPIPSQLNQVRNVYSVQSLKTSLKAILPNPKKDYSKTSSPKIVAIASTANKPDNILYVKSSNAGSFLPNSSIIYTGSTASIINMVPKLLQTTARSGEPGKEIAESQNYIPQSGATLKTVNSVATVNSTTENSVNVAVSNIPSLAPLTSTQTNITNTSPNILDELQTLSSMVPEPLNKAISDLMFRQPPKLKPRPPGPLSITFDEGLPSSAGNVTSKVNSISHRLGDYLRGMLIELLQDVGRTSSPEAEIANLKLEIEQLKHKHSEELLEIKKNIGTVLKDVQKSIVDERNRVIEETRTSCEAECVKRVEEAKSKQWCANCSKEAQFYCCWNTSYCDYPCQQRHWAKHMSKCTQSVQNNQSSTTNNPAKSQQLLLRPTAPPKNFTKSIVAKPAKVIVNNRIPNNKNSFNFSGNHLTLVESTPGSFELLGNGGPISVGGKFITGLGKVKTGSASSVSGSTTASGNTHKAVIISHTKPLANSSPKPSYVTSSISEIDSD